jgi:hypothetical protein
MRPTSCLTSCQKSCWSCSRSWSWSGVVTGPLVLMLVGGSLLPQHLQKCLEHLFKWSLNTFPNVSRKRLQCYSNSSPNAPPDAHQILSNASPYAPRTQMLALSTASNASRAQLETSLQMLLKHIFKHPFKCSSNTTPNTSQALLPILLEHAPNPPRTP